MIGLGDIGAAREVIKGRLHHTPVAGSEYLGRQIGANLFFKLEMFQKTGSFKPRGVLNKMHSLSQREKERGVISLSAGNHAQALAYAASLSGICSRTSLGCRSRRMAGMSHKSCRSSSRTRSRHCR